MEFIIDLLFPPRCIRCDEVTARQDKGICSACITKIKYIRRPYCSKCGKSLRSEKNDICFDCGKKKHYFEAGRALYDYESMAASLYRFKYQGRKEYASAFGREIAVYLGEAIKRWKADGLIPVPIHKKRKRKRGYNQAQLLADELSKHLGIPVYDKMVMRCKNTTPQKELNSAQRQNNLKKAFKISLNDVKLNTIIIIDDIYTTGQTIDEVAKVLHEAGAVKIYFITLAIGAGL